MPIWTDTTKHLVRIAAATAGATLGVVRRVLSEAKDAVDAALVDEVLLQSYLFAGFPRTLNAMSAWREISGLPATPDIEESLSSWSTQGEATCREVYGPVYETLRTNIQRLHPALDRWMITEGYGKVLSRPALDLVTRELCIVAACTAAEQVPQLKSHLRGARNTGAEISDLAATISALADILPLSAITTARTELSRMNSA